MAMKYMEGKKFVHRDLAARNVLVRRIKILISLRCLPILRHFSLDRILIYHEILLFLSLNSHLSFLIGTPQYVFILE